MFCIRRIHDDVMPANKEAIQQVQGLLREIFPGVPLGEINQLGERLRNPFKQRFRSVLLVAEKSRAKILGFAVLSHEPELHFCYLDYMGTSPKARNRGVGSALYYRVRAEAAALAARGLFYECLPDDPGQYDDPKIVEQNAARLKFYERFGALPVVGTAYETPVKPGGRGMPYLVYDSLDRGEPLRAEFARKVVRAVLERKYGHLCPPQYVEIVVGSFRDDPVGIRAPRYVRGAPRPPAAPEVGGERIVMVVNDKHDIHHVRERGYVESPVRIKSILAELQPTGLVERVEPRAFPERLIKAVHAPQFVEYMRRACAEVPEGKSVYPYVFPLRNNTRPPKDLSIQAGYYCIDTFTPLNRSAWLAAKRAVDCAMTAAERILGGCRAAYALVRPPGHHAERRTFGGFCYFNNAAIAAEHFSRFGKVAMLDLDYHHGNGQQDIFYERSDVLTISIHGHPRFAYPYFSGFADERGAGPGAGFNLNIPLPEVIEAAQYRKALAKALDRVVRFDPDFLVVPLGFDTARGDPTGTWPLKPKDFEANGRMVAEVGLPTLIVQEGGYRTRTLGLNARSFFAGFTAGA